MQDQTILADDYREGVESSLRVIGDRYANDIRGSKYKRTKDEWHQPRSKKEKVTAHVFDSAIRYSWKSFHCKMGCYLYN